MKFFHATALSLVSMAAASGAVTAQAPAPATGATPASAASAAPQRQLKLSPKAQPAILALQTAVKAKSAATIPGLLAAAQAAAKTPDDRYAIARLQLQAAAESQDLNGVLAAADAMRANGAAPSELTGIYGAVAGEASRAKQFAIANTALDRLAVLEPNNTDVLTSRAQLMFDQNRNAEGVAILTQAIDRTKAAGAPVPQNWYQNRMAIAYNSKLPGAYGYARDWVAATPTPEHWRNAIGIYRNSLSGDRNAQIDMLRLARATKALSGPDDYGFWATTLVERGYPAEALALLNEGAAGGSISLTSASIAPVYASAKSGVAGERGALAATAKSAMADPSGRLLVRAGDGYFDAGDFARAAALYRAAIGKSGADQNMANLHLGMALTMLGDKPGAAAALQKVTGNPAEIARYWMTYGTVRS